MMTLFYSALEKYYDYIFPKKKRVINVITNLAGKPPKNILDVACSTGEYSLDLFSKGYSIVAIDLNEKMISNLKNKNAMIDSRVMNMLDIGTIDKKFDLIFCIGNSMVHLDNNEEVFRFLSQSREILSENGTLLLQIVNYDRILKKNITSLPSIYNKEKNIVFYRNYKISDDKKKVNFNTILEVGEKKYQNEVDLLALQSDELTSLLHKAGFSTVKLYGDFAGSKFINQESFPLVIIAT
jgi:SAM-dependent methyltransferase